MWFGYSEAAEKLRQLGAIEVSDGNGINKFRSGRFSGGAVLRIAYYKGFGGWQIELRPLMREMCKQHLLRAGYHVADAPEDSTHSRIALGSDDYADSIFHHIISNPSIHAMFSWPNYVASSSDNRPSLAELLRTGRIDEFNGSRPLRVRLNLEGIDLSGRSLRGANLYNVSLKHADLRGVDFTGAILAGSSLELADLTGATFVGCEAQKAFFGGAYLGDATMIYSDFTAAMFADADLSGADCAECMFVESVFERSTLPGALFRQCDFSCATFSDTDTGDSDFSNCAVPAEVHPRQMESESLTRCNLSSKRHAELILHYAKTLPEAFLVRGPEKGGIAKRIIDAQDSYDEYTRRKGDSIGFLVGSFTLGNYVCVYDTTIIVLPRREQVATETYRQGEYLSVYVVDVTRTAATTRVVVSRTHPGLVTKLFESANPEVGLGFVRIEACAREPGFRSKIAVSSIDPDIDPVGVCVGANGSRVQAVIKELRGEVIDIIPYHPDPARFIVHAIAPARVSRVYIDEHAHALELVVPDDQLSKAIGVRGQNVRLAAQLTGWRIDILSESKHAEMNDQARDELSRVDALDAEQVEHLIRHGFRSAQELSDAEASEIAGLLDLEDEAAAQVVARAEIALGQITLEEAERRRAASAPPDDES
jgi:transcription antitermination factor NusA-like protein/uncharacterized protein YjbI with pentapeptide repeats